MARKLLILDDDPAILEVLRRYFADADLELFLEKESDAALQCVKADRPAVALVDITMPRKSGLDVLKEIKEIDPRISVIMMTGYTTTQNAIEAMKQGAYDYLTKPLDFKSLQSVIDKAFQSSAMTRDVRFVKGITALPGDEDETDVMIGSTPEMIEVWKIVGKIADSSAPVLIQGESGTGKELLARSIYSNSKRKTMPFLAVNCATLTENLLESELFGHEKGAFTDASRRHIGKFEQCNGGTIFLDEVAEMSLKNQAKLLRVLENQEFERVGGSETIKVNVRIIAATNRSLVNAVKDKRFRLDLFYRLRVVTIFLPPLRERLEDIPLLIDLFVRRFAREYHKPSINISPAAVKRLIACPWKGNIRELKNVINSAVVTSRSNTLLPEDFEPLIGERNALDHGVSPTSSCEETAMLKTFFETLSVSHEGAVYDRFISEAEKSLIRMTMELCNDNQVHAANFLGISRNKLRQRLDLFKL
jgi:two-component system, NtrC family, nitrogen regulation response regulator GlnG